MTTTIRQKVSHYRNAALDKIPAVWLVRPFEIFLSTMCVISGLPLILGAPRPGSINTVLPDFAANIWGGTLVAGGGLAAIGIIKGGTHIVPSGALALERFGFRLLGMAALIFASTLLYFGGLPALIPSFITLAFGLSCFARVYWLSKSVPIIRRLR